MKDKRVNVLITKGTEATLMSYNDGEITKTEYHSPKEIQRALDAITEELERYTAQDLDF